MTELGSKTPLRSFADLRNSCRGALFIIASGPSVKDFPISRYVNYPMLAMNGSISCFANVGIAPYFYLCDDSSFVRNRLPLLLQATELAENLALSPRVIASLLEREPHSLDGRSVYDFERVNRPPEGGGGMGDRAFARMAQRDPDLECNFSWFRQKPNRIGFSRNLEKGYFSSRTIPYAGIQMAYHLGFRQVFVVGMDLDSSKGRFYEQAADAVRSRLDGDYDDYILPCFKVMAERVITPDFQVYNLSLHSRLPMQIVPKLDLDQVDRLLACS